MLSQFSRSLYLTTFILYALQLGWTALHCTALHTIPQMWKMRYFYFNYKKKRIKTRTCNDLSHNHCTISLLGELKPLQIANGKHTKKEKNKGANYILYLVCECVCIIYAWIAQEHHYAQSTSMFSHRAKFGVSKTLYLCERFSYACNSLNLLLGISRFFTFCLVRSSPFHKIIWIWLSIFRILDRLMWVSFTTKLLTWHFNTAVFPDITYSSWTCTLYFWLTTETRILVHILYKRLFICKRMLSIRNFLHATVLIGPFCTDPWMRMGCLFDTCTVFTSPKEGLSSTQNSPHFEIRRLLYRQMALTIGTHIFEKFYAHVLLFCAHVYGYHSFR